MPYVIHPSISAQPGRTNGEVLSVCWPCGCLLVTWKETWSSGCRFVPHLVFHQINKRDLMNPPRYRPLAVTGGNMAGGPASYNQ